MLLGNVAAWSRLQKRGKCNGNARTVSTMGDTYTPDVKHGDVVKVGAERDPVDVRRRNPVLDLHRPLVHDQH